MSNCERKSFDLVIVKHLKNASSYTFTHNEHWITSSVDGLEKLSLNKRLNYKEKESVFDDIALVISVSFRKKVALSASQLIYPRQHPVII